MPDRKQRHEATHIFTVRFLASAGICARDTQNPALVTNVKNLKAGAWLANIAIKESNT